MHMLLDRFVRVAPGLAVAALLLTFAATALGNLPPATPVVTEPGVGRIVAPADVHMETAPFSDPDAGDTHVCTDWEIWTVAPAPLERVWATLCIGGVERVHTHLGDGTFQGSLTGAREFLPNTPYMLRVRHRDSSGLPASEWSAYGERLFTTGASSQTFPFETDDIADAPAPAWRTPGGQSIVLPVSPVGPQPSLRIETAAGGLLLEIQASDGSSNTILNPAALVAHAAVRVRVSAGALALGLALPETNLTVTTHDGGDFVAYLPAMSVQPGTDAFFWLSLGGSSYVGSSGQTTPDFSQLARGTPVPWAVRQPGYRVEVVATGFQLPVNIAFVPNPGSSPSSPLYYVSELYGIIKVVGRDGVVSDYATGLLNFNPTGDFPGSGEQGLTGLVVDTNGDLYANMLYSSVPGVEAAPHFPKVVKFTSTDGGLTAATQTTILNMVGESMGQSHQISNLTFGTDNKLYVHVGDGFDTARAQDLTSFRGKILRINRNGVPPPDNPFYDALDGITARDHVFAYGFRNPFGGAWRQADGMHYEVENGPSVDRICQVVRARNFLWNGSDASMANFAIYNWNPAVGPVNMAFIQPGTLGGSGFPAAKMDHMFISESGPTWATGPQTNGKRISEFVLDSAGVRQSGPTPLIEYVGSGKATVCALAAGPDGLYFSDLYKDLDYVSPIDRGSNILRVRFVGDADFSADVTSGTAPLTVQFTDTSTVPGPTAWHWDFGDGATSELRNPSHTYMEDGLYTVTLTVTGSAGLSVEDKQGFIRVGVVPRVAIIGSSVPPSAADMSVGDRLRGRGFDVVHLDDEPANRPTAAQIAAEYDLVIVSSTIASASVAGQFRTESIPMIFWENALLRPNREQLTDNGAVVSATAIDVLSNTHQITAGLPLGANTVFTTPSNMSVGLGTIGAGTQVLARRAGSTDGAILVAQAGATVTGGYVTPARRVYLFLEDSSWLAATPATQGILDRSVCWAMGAGNPVFSQQPQSQVVCPTQSATLAVGVQSISPLSFSWRRNGQPIPGATGRTYNVPAGMGGAYDVVVTTPCGSAASATATLTVCPADFNCDGNTDPDDLSDFITCFFLDAQNAGACPAADFNADGFRDPDDLSDYITTFFLNLSCP